MESIAEDILGAIEDLSEALRQPVKPQIDIAPPVVNVEAPPQVPAPSVNVSPVVSAPRAFEFTITERDRYGFIRKIVVQPK